MGHRNIEIMKPVITLAAILVILLAVYTHAEDKTQTTSTNVHTAMLFPVGLDTKKSIPASIASADAPILTTTTNTGSLKITFTNKILNIIIASPGYTDKTIQLSGSEKMSIVGMEPKQKAPTSKSTVP